MNSRESVYLKREIPGNTFTQTVNSGTGNLTLHCDLALSSHSLLLLLARNPQSFYLSSMARI